MADADFLGRIVPELEKLLPMLDERARRLVLGAVAGAAGEGGTGAVAKAAGASWQTVADGRAELDSGDSATAGRVRRPGAGRKPLASTDEGLVAALRGLLEGTARGDPGSPLRWTTLSVREIAGQLAAAGHRCGKNVVARLLAAEGYSLQGNSRTIEGKQHPDRDAQFRYISHAAEESLAAGDPVISVDTKKRELVGPYAQKGRSWRPAGDPVRVRDHDFPGPDGTAIPYGIYDAGASAGFVNVGTGHDTAAFAAEPIRRWWHEHGAARYPHARRLLVTADAGGANSCRARGWKAQLAELAAETGLVITVLHFPPGTSKWNTIEHRLFCHISRTWRARPLTSHQVIIDTIAATATAAGLTVTARLDLGTYPAGLQVSDQQWQHLQDRVIARHDFHGEWNYTLLPAPRPAPAAPAAPPAAPQPAAPGQAAWHHLTHPGLTGMSRQDFDGLASALHVPFHAAREQYLYRLRGGPRKHPRKPSPLARAAGLHPALLATIYRQRLGMPLALISPLIGADPTTISHATTRMRKLLTQAGITIPPAPAPITTTASLRAYATAHGITLPGTPQPAAPHE